jgi:hypothetical protein
MQVIVGLLRRWACLHAGDFAVGDLWLVVDIVFLQVQAPQVFMAACKAIIKHDGICANIGGVDNSNL